MGRAPCCDKNGLKKGPWTPEEDQKLIDYIQKNGYGNWRTLPKNAGLQRCGKSCRLRWTNYLRPDIKRGRFSFEEEETIIQLHSVIGNKWSAIASRLPGRTDNEIKNYWNTHIRKKLMRMGIDPVTHSPRLDLLDLSMIQQHSSSYSNVLQSQNMIMNLFPRLLGLQTLLNPELIIRLATSLLCSNLRDPNQIPPSPTIQNSQIDQNPVQDLTNSNEFEQLSQNLDGFGPGQVNEWQQNDGSSLFDFSTVTTEANYVPVTNFGCYGSGHFIVDQTPSSETSTFQSNGSSNLTFQSVLSTPYGSPTPLQDSSSTYNNNNNNITEDEREISFCSNMFKFEIPEIFSDVNDFIKKKEEEKGLVC